MNNTFKNILLLVTGAVIGAGSVYKYLDKKHQARADKEIEVSKRLLESKKEAPVEEPVDKVEPVKKNIAKVEEDEVEYDRFADDVKTNYASIAKQYTHKETITTMVTEVHEPGQVDPVSIYTITPDEYGMQDGFNTYEMYYTSDNKVLDADLRVLSDVDIDEILGGDPGAWFGEYDDQNVFVRNEDFQCDYNVCLCLKTADEIRSRDGYK